MPTNTLPGWAIELCQQIRFRPELSLSRLDRAKLLLGHYPPEHGLLA